MNNVVTKKINFTLLISKVDKHNDWIENVDAESVLKGVFESVTPTELIVGTEFAKSTIKCEVLRELNRLGIIKDIYGKESVYLGISICVGKDNYVYISVNVESK